MSEPDVGVTRRPTPVSSAIAVVAAIGAAAIGGSASAAGLAIGLAGVIVLLAGLARGARTGVDLGSLALFLGVVAGGIEGVSVELTLIATVSTVLAWDLGSNAIDLGDQLGREANTSRLETVHAGSSLLVGLATATTGYAVYVFTADEQPASAVALLLVAAFLVTLGLATSRGGRAGRRGRPPHRR